MKRLINWVKDKLKQRKRQKQFEKKLKELKKRDPFIYNH
jgi:hypothetical protein